MSQIRHLISGLIRERVLQRWGIPFSRHGIDPGMVRFFHPREPIAYIDVGASVGDVAAAIQKQYGIKRGILIEPQPARCRQLRQRFDGLQLSIHECALGDSESQCEMEILNWDYSSSLLHVRRDLPNVTAVLDLTVRETITCRVTTLDALVREAQWDSPIDLLKIDVQGAELMTLRGADHTLQRVESILAEVSLRQLYDGSCVLAQVYDFLCSRGFRLLSLRDAFRGGDGELLQCDAFFSR